MSQVQMLEGFGLANTIADPEERSAVLDERYGAASSRARSLGCCMSEVGAAKARRNEFAATWERLERTVLFNPDGSPRDPSQAERERAVREIHAVLDRWEASIRRLEVAVVAAETAAANGEPVQKAFFRWDNPVLWIAGVAAGVAAWVAAGGSPFGETLIVKGAPQDAIRQLSKRDIPFKKVRRLSDRRFDESRVDTPKLDEDDILKLMDWFGESPPTVPKRGFKRGTLLFWR